MKTEIESTEADRLYRDNQRLADLLDRIVDYVCTGNILYPENSLIKAAVMLVDKANNPHITTDKDGRQITHKTITGEERDGYLYKGIKIICSPDVPDGEIWAKDGTATQMLDSIRAGSAGTQKAKYHV